MRPSVELVFKLLDYERETGKLYWKRREVFKTRDKVFNANYAGKEAGSAEPGKHRRVEIKGTAIYSHLIVWAFETGSWPPRDIDHKNVDKLDNRFLNLRLATRSENCANRLIQKNNTSGYKGVSWESREKRWRAQIQVNQKNHRLGSFASIEEARSAYAHAATKFFGEFGRSE